MSDPHVLSEFRVWTIPHPANSDFSDFAFDSFVYRPRLIALRVSDAAGGRGSASFRLLRGLREENGVYSSDEDSVEVGSYIAVTKGISSEEFDEDQAIFFGYVSSKDVTQVSGSTDVLGSVSALGLGRLLDTIQLSGFRQATASGGPSTALLTPPTFNIAGDGGVVIGNKINDDQSVPVLAGLPSLCSPSSLFSRKDVLAHIFAYCVPPGVPPMVASSDTSEPLEYLESTTDKQVFDLSGLTIAGAIDLLISRSQGLGWKIVPADVSGIKWRIVVYALVDSVPEEYGTGFPSAVPTDISAEEIEAESIGYRLDASEIYDSVTVEGDNILVGASVSFADGNLAKGWTTTQETAYKAGASGSAGYDSLSSEEEQAIRNEEVRNSSGLSDVFQLITLNMSSNNILRSASPGTGSSSAPLIPKVEWNSPTATVGTANCVPYLPGARLSRVVPWLVGVSGDGTDSRDTSARSRPEYLKPRVFRYDTGAPSYSIPESVCADLLIPSNNSGQSRPSPTVTPDDRTPGLRIAFSPNEFMARGHWDDDADAVTRVGSVEADARSIDYEKLLLTVGIPSDQKVSVTIRRQGVAEGKERARLIVRDSDLQCWLMLAGSVVGTNEDGQADRVAADTFVRNDFPTAQRMATALAAFAFRKRTSVTLTLAQPDNIPAWASIGTMIGRVTEQVYGGQQPSVIADAYTTIESIDYDLRYESPRVTVSTTLPSSPSFSGGSPSPSAGGAVSSSLGGTVAQAVQGEQVRGQKTMARTASVPTSVGVSIGAATIPYLVVEVEGGNTLETGQDGIVYEASVASVPSAYDPDVTSSFIDGIGRGTLYIDGVAQAGYVLVVNDDSGTFQNALLQYDKIFTQGAVSIPVDGGGSVKAYVAG